MATVQRIEGVWGVIHHFQCTAPAVALEKLLDRGEGNSKGLLSCSNYPLQCCFVWHTAVGIPRWYTCTVCQNMPLSKSPEDAGGDRGLFHPVPAGPIFWSLRCSCPSSGASRSEHLRTWCLLLSPLGSRWYWEERAGSVSSRLFTLHQPTRRSTSFLYIDSSFLQISPTTVISSSNLITSFPSYLDTQSCVNSMNNSGLRTHPWGDPALSMVGLEMFLPRHVWCSAPVSGVSLVVSVEWWC